MYYVSSQMYTSKMLIQNGNISNVPSVTLEAKNPQILENHTGHTGPMTLTD